MTGNPESDFASPPCFAHELEWGENGAAAVDPVQARDVARWRKGERERLISERLAVPADERKRVAGDIAAELDRIVAPRPGLVVSLYWPFRGELDLREWMKAAHGRGARMALPIAEALGRPLRFRQWSPGARMERGVWNIPVPADGPELAPDVVIAPLVGFDPDGYRLGYGGGFFDRTLAGMAGKPLTIGVAHPVAAIATIYPQPHDIPMDIVVTGCGKIARRGSSTG